METDLEWPLEPMLGKLARTLPADGYLYEPKWDGFRCLGLRAGEVDLRSRHGRPLSRYFPELVAGIERLSGPPLLLDGEIVVSDGRRLDFGRVMGRLHPSKSRVERLSAEQPAILVVFDVLAEGGRDLRETPFEERRRRLGSLLAEPPASLRLTPCTADRALAARWLRRYRGAGIDGVMAKHRESRYLPGKREMIKVKQERTADCVVAGFRPALEEPLVASLLLGLYDDVGALRHVGVVSSLKNEARRRLLDELAPLAIHLERHPWRGGYLLEGGPVGRLPGSAGRWTPGMRLDWVPLAPERVCEVAYDQVDAGCRFRHPARWRRWRPDRTGASCRLDQLLVEDADPIATLLPP